MKLLLDSTRCQGYGLCQEAAADLIDLDEWGYAAVVAEPGARAPRGCRPRRRRGLPQLRAPSGEVTMGRDLSALFDPKSVAVVGASDDPAK